jgi:tRNA A37 methylthiotransferase MiaB
MPISLSVNTCSVTASADQGARQTIRRIARTNPGVRVVVTGLLRDAKTRGSQVSFRTSVRVIANSRKDSLVSLLEAEGELTDRGAVQRRRRARAVWRSNRASQDEPR